MSPHRLLPILLSLSLTWVGCHKEPPTASPDAGGTPAPSDGGNTSSDGGNTFPDGGNAFPDGGDTASDAGNTSPDSGDSASDGGNSAPDGGDSASDAGDSVSDGGDTLPDGGGTLTDGGSPSGDGGTEGGLDASTPVDPNTVTVTGGTRYHSTSGVTTVVRTVYTNTELLIPDGTSFLHVAGTVQSDGSLLFSDVPQGTYYLRSGSTYVVTDARTLDLSVDLLGRPDAGIANASGEMAAHFDVSGLEPSDAGDPPSFEVISGEVDFAAQGSADSYVPAGQSTYVGDVPLFNMTGPVPEFIAERGDRAWVNQLGSRVAGKGPNGEALRYDTVVRSFQLPPFSYDGGTPAEMQGTFQPLPMTDVDLEWNLPAFSAYAPAVHPQATISTSLLYAAPAAHGLGNGLWVGYSGELFTLGTSRGTSDYLDLHFTFGNPYPSTWGVVAQASTNFRVTTSKLSNGTAVNLTTTLGITDRLSTLAAGAIGPRMSPPRGLVIDGQDAYTPRTLGSTHPVVSWTPPELGTPSLYALSIYRYDPPTTGTTPVRTLVSRFYVAAAVNSVTLPENILQPAKDYQLQLTAYSSPGTDLSRTPFNFANIIPNNAATTMSDILTTP